MNDNDITHMDWEAIWLARMTPPKHKRQEMPDWDKQAEEFERQFSRSDYRDKMVQKIHVWPEATVLDVGCGPGTLALPLAPRVKHVTALDISRGMLRVGQERAKELGIDNIDFICHDWQETTVGKDIRPHDIVVCSRAFGGGKSPRESLLKLDAAASRFVYMTLKTRGGSDFFARVNMGPGRSVSFGKVSATGEKGSTREVSVFALSGPPSGCINNFETLVRPAMFKMMGRTDIEHPWVEAVAMDIFPDKNPMAMVKWTYLEKVPGSYRVSLNGPDSKGPLGGMATANSITIIPEYTEVAVGDTIRVLPVDWNR